MKNYTTNEAAELLRVSRTTIMRMIHDKSLPGARKTGRGARWVIPESDLAPWLSWPHTVA